MLTFYQRLVWYDVGRIERTRDAVCRVTYLAEQFIREIGETHKKVPAAKNYYVFW